MTEEGLTFEIECYDKRHSKEMLKELPFKDKKLDGLKLTIHLTKDDIPTLVNVFKEYLD